MIWALPFIFIVIVVLWGYLSANLILRIPKSPIEITPRSFGRDHRMPITNRYKS